MSSPKSFSDEISAFLLQHYQDRLSQVTLIVPNYPLSHSILRTLGRSQRKVSWAPRVYTLRDFLQEASDIHIPERMALLRYLYDVVKDVSGDQESFGSFLSWAESLLHDFNTIDHYLIPRQKLFAIPTIGAPSNALENFWAALQENPTQVQRRWLRLWKLIPRVYEAYTQRLLKCRLAYEGLQRSTLLAALEQGRVDIPHKHIVAVGLHELTPVEERILAALQGKVSLDFCWDRDGYYCQEPPAHPAGYYFRRRGDDPLFKQALPQDFYSHMQARPPKVKVVAAQGIAGELEALKRDLSVRIKQEGKAKVASNTVIVVPDPTLLIPLIHTVPITLGSLNLRIGYPLIETPIYAFLIALLRFQLACREAGGRVTNALILSLQVLCDHPYLSCDQPLKQKLVEVAHRDTQELRVAAQELGDHAICVVPFNDNEDSFDLVKACLALVDKSCRARNDIPSWEKTAIRYCADLWDQISTAWPKPTVGRKISDALIQLLHRQSQNVTLPVHNPQGEEGIAVMALSQTLGLDFKYVYILSMNEGVMPAPHRPNTFVPHLLQESVGWTEKQAKEAMTAYPLYRLLQRAEKVLCTYSYGDKSRGERSRYLYDLSYTLGWPIEEHSLAHPVVLGSPKAMVIPKDRSVLDRLASFKITTPPEKRRVLTPSALNMYLECPCCFYLHYVAHVKPPKAITTAMDPLTFGNLFHAVMEQIYRPYVGSTIDQGSLGGIKKNYQEVIEKVYERPTLSISRREGDDLMVKKILATFAGQVLKADEAYAPFTILGLEHRYDRRTAIPFSLSDGQKIALGGILDRIDSQGHTIRIVDYKTGAYSAMIPSIGALFDRSLPSPNRVALQLCAYAWLYHQQPIKEGDLQIMPAVISTRQAWQQAEHSGFFISGREGAKPIPLTDITPYVADFEEKLRAVLDELFDASIPFRQRDREKHSAYGLCQSMGV